MGITYKVINYGQRLPDLKQHLVDVVADQMTINCARWQGDGSASAPNAISAIGHQRQDCYVEARPSTLHGQLTDMNHVTRQATRWGALSDSGDLSSMDFSVGSDYCLAFEKRGPR